MFNVGDVVKVVKRSKYSTAVEKDSYIGDVFVISGIDRIHVFPYELRYLDGSKRLDYLFKDEELELYSEEVYIADDSEIESLLS